MSTLTFNPIALSYVLPLYFDQQDHESLDALLRKYAAYDPQLLDRILFVLVDDGSPTPVRLPSDIDLNILLLRIREDISWNQGGARNLGVVYSRSDTVLATDVDHEYSEATLRHIVNLPPLGRTMYRFHTLDPDGRAIHSHPNSFVMSRGRFLQLYGVDEEFSGAYCCEDGTFWRWQRYHGTRFFYLPRRFPAKERRVDRARSYHTLPRDKTVNTELKYRKRREMAIYGPAGGHSRKFLAFTWDVAEERSRRPLHWRPPIRRWWKRTWFLRWLFGDRV